MSNSKRQTSRAEDFLPDWSIRRFILLDKTKRWAAPITTQCAQCLNQHPSFSGRPPEFETCESAKETLLFCDQDSTLGVILFVDGMERECLTFLGRLARMPLRPPILAVCLDSHTELLPTLLEAGVDTALFNVTNDVPIAEWCVRITLNRIV